MLKNLVLTAVATLLALGLAELAARLLLGGAPTAGPRLYESPDKRLALQCYPDDPAGYFPVDLGDAATRARYAALPGLDEAARTRPRCIEVRYDARLHRGPDPGPRRAGVRRVAVFGDSFTEGQGVRAEDTLPARLGARLPELEVLGAGRRGRDFPELRRAFDERVLPLEPDLVVYALVLNDAARSPAFDARQGYVNDFITDRGAVRDPGKRPWSALWAVVTGRLEARRLARETTRWYRELWGAENAAGADATFAHVAAMRDALAARGARLLVAVLPLLVDGDPFAGVHAAILARLGRLGVAAVDLRPAVAGERAARLWAHPLDMHPNARAHDRFAAHLERPVRDALR